MKITKFLSALGIALCLTATAFAGSPKSEPKTDAKTETKAVSQTKETLYYFLISDDGSAFDSRSTDISHTESDCNSDGLYCEVGLPESDVDISGSTVTVKSGVTAPPMANRTRQD